MIDVNDVQYLNNPQSNFLILVGISISFNDFICLKHSFPSFTTLVGMFNDVNPVHFVHSTVPSIVDIVPDGHNVHSVTLPDE